MIYSLSLAVLAFIFARVLISGGIDPTKWQYWVSMICVLLVFIVGILSGRSLC